MKKLIQIIFILILINQLIKCKKKGIKYKFVPVEVPKPNYLLDKKLTNKELKNAWRVFEYSGIKNYQAENNGEPNQPLLAPPPPTLPLVPIPNQQITNPIQSTKHQQQDSESDSDHIEVNGNQIKINPDQVKHIKINSMKPSVIYQRKMDQNTQNNEQKSMVDDEYEDLENETIKDSIRNDLRDNLDDNLDDNLKNNYKDISKDNLITKQVTMSKRKNRTKKRIPKKIYYDDTDEYDD